MAITYRGERFENYNKPKLTRNHPTKKAAVLARVKKDGKFVIKLIRFGQQGYGHNYSDEARRAYKARFARLIAKKDKLSATYWANRFLWSKSGIKRQPE
tara:strand:- start:398 stop:694 length:297 start_codon:yes stop_codon:yes gene_type:complete